MRNVLVILLLFVAGIAAADPIEEVRQAEIAFAKAFADRDEAKFFALVAPDANFLGGLSTQKGKEQVYERWSRFFKAPEAPFSWGPERVVINGDGTLGLSTGPVFDTGGKHAGNYSSIWQKQKDGSWKIIFDGVGPAVALLPENAVPFEEGFVTADDGVRLKYRKIGAGPLTLIVPLDFMLYDDFKQLADVATVITYDMRNRGRSDAVKDVNTLTIQQDVKDLEAVRRTLKAEKFIPIGFSYLGKMVAIYTLDHPDRVTRVIQLGPVPMNFGTEYPKALTRGFDDVAITAEENKQWQELRKQGVAEKTPKEFCAVEFNVMAHVLVGNGRNAARIRNWCDMENEWPVNSAKHLARHFESVKSAPLTKDALQKLSVPVLTIHGTYDRNAPYGGGREWAMTLPNARLVTVPGGAHQSWADDPVTVFAAVRAFLRGDWPLGAEKVTKLEPAS